MIDGLNSVKNGLKEGVVAGGGASLLHASKLLDFLQIDSEDSEMNAGVSVLRMACKEPIKALMDNAGIDGDFVAEKLLAENDSNFGFCLLKEDFVDLMEEGVVDSVFNLKNILHDSCSIAGMMLTCEVMVVQKYRYLPKNIDEYPKEPF